MLCGYVPNYLLHISLIFNSCQTGIFGKWRLLNNCGIVYFARANVLHSSIFFSCARIEIICWTAFALATSSPRTVVCKCVCSSGCDSVYMWVQGGHLVDSLFSSLTCSSQKPCSVSAHCAVQTCPQAGATHTHTHLYIQTHTPNKCSKVRDTYWAGNLKKYLYSLKI